MAALSAPLLRRSHRRGPSRSCCRSSHIRSPAYQLWHGKAPPIPRCATTGGSAHEPPYTCRMYPVDLHNTPHCPPSTGSHRHTADYTPLHAQAVPPHPEYPPPPPTTSRPSAPDRSKI